MAAELAFTPFPLLLLVEAEEKSKKIEAERKKIQKIRFSFLAPVAFWQQARLRGTECMQEMGEDKRNINLIMKMVE